MTILQNLPNDFYGKSNDRIISFETSEKSRKIEIKSPHLVMRMEGSPLSVIREGDLHLNKEGEVTFFVKANREVDNSFSNALLIKLTESEATAYDVIEDMRYSEELLLDLIRDPELILEKIESAVNLIIDSS